MKVGDKLYCKNDIANTSIKIGWECIVETLSEDQITIKYDYRTRYFLQLKYHDISNVYDHFYTEKEYRKLKLNKINEKI